MNFERSKIESQDTGKERIDEVLERSLELISESAEEVLAKEEVQDRAEKAKESIWALDTSAYEGVYYQECGDDGGVDTTPAFVRGRADYGCEDEIGKIVINKTELKKSTGSEEAQAIILHLKRAL